ncbi:MAG TPA: ester cyclase [Casimicrobiaceae bacterium]|nr:ester cyclase [Casimicrobiaceae bacterium]
MKIHASAFALLAAVSVSVLPGTARAQTLTIDQAREIVAPFYRALNAGNDSIALVNQATSAEWVSCGGNDTCRGRDQVGASIAGLQKAVPDLKWEIKEVVVSGDRVIVRGEASGTPAGTFMGVPGGGKSFRIMSIDVHTVRDGKMIRAYHVEDWMGVVRQLSAP